MCLSVSIQTCFRRKPFVTYTAVKWLFSNVYSLVKFQTTFPFKPFITHSTQMLHWLVIMWMLGDIITISLSLCLDWFTYITAIYFSQTCWWTLCKHSRAKTSTAKYIWTIQCEKINNKNRKMTTTTPSGSSKPTSTDNMPLYKALYNYWLSLCSTPVHTTLY